MHVYMKSRLFALVLIGCLGIVGCNKNTPRQTDGLVQDESELQVVDVREVANPELESRYEKAVRDIMDQYRESGYSDDLQQELLAVTAPGRYLDLHLSLVLAFENLSGDAAQQELGRSHIDELSQEYRWLR